MLILTSCEIAYKDAHMHVHLKTSFCLILPTKTLLDRYDGELDLQYQEELWMSDEEPTDSAFQDIVPRVTMQVSIHTQHDFHYNKCIHQELRLCYQSLYAH